MRFCSLLTVLFTLPFGRAFAAWEGVDEKVVEGMAARSGREADPLIGFMEGDILLFAFLVAGAVGGFIGGYYFRSLFGKRGNG